MPKFAANLTMMFNESQFLDRFAAANEAGFKGVEYLFPYDYPVDQLIEKLEKHNLEQVLHNLPAGDWDNGERGIACHPNRQTEFQEGVGKAIEYASALGCPQVNCLAGITPKGETSEKMLQTFVSNLEFAAKQCEAVGIVLLIEPINTHDIPGFYLTNTTQALSVINEVSSSNVMLQYDVYHMQIMEGNLLSTIRANLDLVRHIQIADNPGRNEPGTGEINYPFLFDALDELKYDGWIGCEYKPETTTIDGLGWAKDYLSL